jgi:hypothetical protein
MPITTDLNQSPYYDDFSIEKQFYRVLFKPRRAVQARELTQLQTILQNQVEQFGDNIFQEGSIIKGCNFTELNDLRYVKLANPTSILNPTTGISVSFDVLNYVGPTADEIDNNIDVTFEIENENGLRASIVSATRGFLTAAPNTNTFYINYLNTIDEALQEQKKVFGSGEPLTITKISTFLNEAGTTEEVIIEEVGTINVASVANNIGNSFGLRVAEGVIFQKGYFLFVNEQLIIVEKYNNQPNQVSIGFDVQESIVTSLEDNSLYDNAVGSPNENAPGADRLKLIPQLIVRDTVESDIDPTFFTLIRYENGASIQIRDVSQYNVIGEEMARRTYEESGDYIVDDFNLRGIVRDGVSKVAVSPGLAYVKGYRVANSGEVILEIPAVTTTEIQQNQPVSFGYGGYINVREASGTLSIGDYDRVDLLNAESDIIGTAIVKNYTPEKVFLFDVRMNSNSSLNFVDSISGDTGLVYVSNDNIITSLKETEKSTSIFETGAIGLKSTSDTSIPIRTSQGFSGVTTSISITLLANEDFLVDNSDILVVDNLNNIQLDVTGITVSSNYKTLTVNLASSGSGAGIVYYNKRIVLTEPHTKQPKEVFVKSTFVTNPASNPNNSQKYNLGFPDVYEIVSITDFGGNDVTNSFRLFSNQKDNYYDHSYIELISGRTVPDAGLMTIQLKTFQVNADTGSYYFSVDSYLTELTVNAGPTLAVENIPVYKSNSNKNYDLRDCLDFRPYIDVLGSYTATSSGSAPIINAKINITPTFSGSYVIPALNNSAILDYEYYLSRRDIVAIDTYGRISYIQGQETTDPRPPTTGGNKIIIGEVYIPSYPALSSEVALRTNRPNYAIKTKKRGIKNWTMKDINDLSKNIDRLYYYATVSALEASTQNLSILDENGLTRFKNGIVVDPFNDLSIADLENTEFNSAVDFTRKLLMPSVKSFPLNLKVDTTRNTNVTIHPTTLSPEIATINKDQDISLLSQKYATNFRNCVSNFYYYRGTGFSFPEYDGAYDMINNPEAVIDIDFETPFREFVENFQEFYPLTSTESTLVGSNTSIDRQGRTTTTTTNRTFQDFYREFMINSGKSNEQKVGDFVTNFQFNPYMRSREVKLLMFGLRPNTQHYPFFDEANVAALCAPGTVADDVRNVQSAGVIGDTLVSDVNGVLSVVFQLPENTFYVGDRIFELADVSTYENIGSAATSKGFVTYRAYNFSIEKTGLTVSTRQPEFSIAETSTLRTVTNRTTVTRDGGGDPIAQTFFVKQNMGLGSDTVFASKIDLYFKRKSATNGVTIMLREVENGYPSIRIMPFSKVHLNPEDVSVSEDGSIATTIFFKAPVRLDTEKEYSIVIMPDANDPDYFIFTSKVGSNDLQTGGAITQDWGDGVLFTSTNNRAWQSYQDEDLKFTVYRANFNEPSATLTMTNDDHEFISLTNNIGIFQNGETVYAEKGSTFTVGSVYGSIELSGTITGITNGDYVVLEYLTQKIIAKVTDTNGVILDRPVNFKTITGENYTGNISVTSIVIGTLVHYNVRDPLDIVLEQSSARTGRIFQAGDTIYGISSQARSTVDTVDDIQLSYMQPMIARTNDSVSNVTISGTFTDPNDSNVTYSKAMTFNDRTAFNNKGVRIYSKSNNLSGATPFLLQFGLTNGANVTSTPIIDVETAMMFAYQYRITGNADTTTKYVSKSVELIEDFDAEDFRLYLTGYRPLGTDIKVYMKFQNNYDPLAIENNDWIELNMIEGSTVFCSTTNLDDFREYVYDIPSASKIDGVLTYTNETGTYSGFKKFIIKIEMTSENIYDVPRVLDYRGLALT